MAEETTPDGLPILKPASADFTTDGLPILKKKELTTVSKSGSTSSGSGFVPSQNSLQSLQSQTDLSPIISPEVRQQNKLHQRVQDNLPYNNGADNSVLRDAGKKQSTLQRIGTGIKSAAANLGQGIAESTISPLYYAGNKLGLVSDQDYADIQNKISTTPLLGLHPDYLKEGGGKFQRTVGDFARMAPALITAEGTGGGSFGLQTMGDAATQVAQMKKQGIKFDNHSDDLFILGSGIIGTALGSGSVGKVFGSFGKGVQKEVATKLATETLQELGKKASNYTADDIAKAFLTKAQSFGQKVATGGLDAFKTYLKTGGEMAAANAATVSLKKAANNLNKEGEEPFKDGELGNVPEAIGAPFYNNEEDANGNPFTALGNVLTSPAGTFGAIGGIGSTLGLLTQKGGYFNPVVDRLKENSSPEEVGNIKADLTDIGKQKGWSDAEINNAHAGVDMLAETVGKLPKQLPNEKLAKGVQLVIGRNDLQKELEAAQAERNNLDASVNDIPTAHEQLIADKIDQANDKIRSLVTGDRITYSKGVGEEEGKFYKTIGGKKEEITPQRYDLESLERGAKAADNKIPETTQNVEPAASNEVGEPISEQQETQEPINEPNEQGSETTPAELPVQAESSQQIETPVNSEPIGEAPVGQTEEIASNNDQIKKTADQPQEAISEQPVPDSNQIKEQVDNTQPKAGDPLRSFASKIREGKINKLGGFRASTGFDAVWDGSLEVVAKTLEGGAKVADAIEAGLKHVKESEWYKSLTNKEDFDKQYREHLNSEYSEHEKAAPIKNETSQERADAQGIEIKDTRNGTRGADKIDVDATKSISDGYDTPDLINRILNDKHQASDTEIAILSKYTDAKEREIKGYDKELSDNGATMSKGDFNALMAKKTQAQLDFQDALQAARQTGTETARALAARRNSFNQEYSLANMVARKREALGGDKLTSEQFEEINKRFGELEQARKDLETKLAKLEEDNAKLKAQQELKKTASERITRKPVSKVELAKEREDLRSKLSQDLKKIRSTSFNSAGKATAEFIAVVAPYVVKMARNLAQEGVIEVKAVVARLKEEFKDELPELSDKDYYDILGGAYDTQRLDAAKNRLNNKIEDLETRLENGDLTKPPQRLPLKLDAEALELRRKYDRLKANFDLEVAKDQLRQRTKSQKLWDDFLNVATLPRALKASLDFSAVLRQGLFASIGHPKQALEALKEMFGQTFSEKRYENWLADIKHSEFYDLMKNSDLYIADKNDPKILAREEEFTSNLADKIPGFGKVVAASERAYTGYLNALRTGVFADGAQRLLERGYTFEKNPEQFKGLAKVVNVLTGRGDIPETIGGKQPKFLSNVLFSPRFMAARIQTLYLWADPRLPKEARIMAAKDIGKTLAVGAALISLAKLSGYKVITDPRSVQFLKIQDKQEHGTTYYDILGGLPQYVRFLSQQISGKKIPASNKGIVSLTTGKPHAPTRLSEVANFGRGKVSPLIGIGLNLLEGKDVIGQPYHLWPNVPQEFIPLPFTDVQEAYKVGGIDNALKAFLPSQFGISTSSYDPNKKNK